MKRRGFVQLLVGSAAGTAVLTACSNGEGGTGGGEGGGDYRIAIVPKDATNPWFVRMEVGVKKYAEESGLEVFQRGPAETDATQQAQVIRDLIAQNVSAIGVVPVDIGALEPVLKEAMDAGIVVVAHEGASLQNMQYDIEAFSNEAYGGFIMQNLAQGMGEEGLYTTMVGSVTNASHNEWADGGVKYAQENYPNMKLLDAQPRIESGDTAEGAYQAAKEVLRAHPDLRGIMGTSSFDAPGVARAIEEMGLKDKVFTAGTGMPQANKEILQNGTVHALTLWDPADAGYALAALAKKLLDGEEIQAPVDLGVQGYEAMEFNADNDKVLEGEGWVVITADNVDEFDF